MIGTRGIGTRFNVLMTIQIPLQQKPKEYDRDLFGGDHGIMGEDDWCFEEVPRTRRSRGAIQSSRAGRVSSFRRIAASSAARVSKGSTLDDNLWTGLSVKDPVRHPSEHITATIVMYYTCSGGVPSTADIKAAIDDLEQLYKVVEVNGKLADAKFDFMKSALTVKDVDDIKSKIDTQPPKPDLPLNANVFPS